MTGNEYQVLAGRTFIKEPGFEISKGDMMLVFISVALGAMSGGISDSVKKGIYHQHGMAGKEGRKLIECHTEALHYVNALNQYPDFPPYGRVLTGQEQMTVWNTLGLLGEAGEYATDVLRGVLCAQQGDHVLPDRRKKELGDMLWYIAAECTNHGLLLDDVMQTNIDKLIARYPDGYSSEASINRLLEDSMRKFSPKHGLFYCKVDDIKDRKMIVATIEFAADPSVGIMPCSYRVELPNGFTSADTDEECSKWMEETRMKLYEMYRQLDGDFEPRVIFDWEYARMEQPDDSDQSLLLSTTIRPSGLTLIAQERQRQISAEGYDTNHDDEHDEEQMAYAAMCYVTPHMDRDSIMGSYLSYWPWTKDSWKPAKNESIDERIKELAKAGALTAAEIDRLQRSRTLV